MAETAADATAKATAETAETADATPAAKGPAAEKPKKAKKAAGMPTSRIVGLSVSAAIMAFALSSAPEQILEWWQSRQAASSTPSVTNGDVPCPLGYLHAHI